MEQDERKTHKTMFSSASIISLLTGLAAVAVSLYVFYASRDRPALQINQLPSITYASTEALKDLGEVRLTIDGNDIDNLRAIPFSIRNVGNIPISSLDKSEKYNLVGPLVLQLTSLPSASSRGEVLVVETELGLGTPLSVNTSQKDNNTIIEITLRNLNVGEETNFTILYTGDSDPTASILGNPLLGGKLSLLLDSRSVEPANWWSQFKSIWLPEGLGVLLNGAIRGRDHMAWRGSTK